MPGDRYQVEIDLKGNAKQLKGAMRQAGRSSDRLKNKINKNNRAVQASTAGVGRAFKALAASFAGIAAVRGFFSVAVSFEKLRVKLETFTGSQKEASVVWERLNKVAATTQVDVDKLIDSYTQLRSVGIDPTSTEIKRLADLAAATGLEFGQLSNIIFRGTSSTELFYNAGITARVEGEKLRVTYQGVTKVIDKQSAAIKDYLVELTKTQGYVGASEKLAKGIGGALSNIVGNFKALVEETFKTSGAINWLADSINYVGAKFATLREDIVKANSALDAFSDFVGLSKLLSHFEVFEDGVTVGIARIRDKWKDFLADLDLSNVSIGDLALPVLEFQVGKKIFAKVDSTIASIRSTLRDAKLVAPITTTTDTAEALRMLEAIKGKTVDIKAVAKVDDAIKMIDSIKGKAVGVNVTADVTKVTEMIDSIKGRSIGIKVSANIDDAVRTIETIKGKSINITGTPIFKSVTKSLDNIKGKFVTVTANANTETAIKAIKDIKGRTITVNVLAKVSKAEKLLKGLQGEVSLKVTGAKEAAKLSTELNRLAESLRGAGKAVQPIVKDLEAAQSVLKGVIGGESVAASAVRVGAEIEALSGGTNDLIKSIQQVANPTKRLALFYVSQGEFISNIDKLKPIITKQNKALLKAIDAGKSVTEINKIQAAIAENQKVLSQYQKALKIVNVNIAKANTTWGKINNLVSEINFRVSAFSNSASNALKSIKGVGASLAIFSRIFSVILLPLKEIKVFGGKILGALGKVAGPLIAIFAVIDLWSGATDVEKLKANTGKAVEDITTVDKWISSISEAVGNFLEAFTWLAGQIAGMFGMKDAKKWLVELDISKHLSKFIVGAKDWLSNLFTGATDFSSLGEFSLQDTVKSLVKTLKDGIVFAVKGIFNFTVDVLGSISGFVTEKLSALWDSVTGLVTGWFKNPIKFAGDLLTVLTLPMRITYDTITGILEGLFDIELPSFGDLTNLVKNQIIKTYNMIEMEVKSFFDFELPSFGDIGDVISKGVQSALDKAKSAVSDFFSFGGDNTEGKATGGLIKAASGGFVRGSGSGTSDSIPAMLSNGEFVINAESTKKYGALLEQLNSNKFAKGGPVGYQTGGRVQQDGMIQRFSQGFIDEMEFLNEAEMRRAQSLIALRLEVNNANLAGEETIHRTKEYSTLLGKVKGDITEMNKALEQLSDTATTGFFTDDEKKGIVGSLSSSIANAVRTGKWSGVRTAVLGTLRDIFLKRGQESLEKFLTPIVDSISNTIGNSLSKMDFGGGAGGLFGGIGDWFTGLFAAKGGYVTENGLKPAYFADGGFAKGTDTIPAMLTPGELVLNKNQQKMMGNTTVNETYNFEITATDAQSFKAMIASDPQFLASVAKSGERATQGLRRR